jgi:Zn-dependent peptidase ImmA (M78 family)
MGSFNINTNNVCDIKYDYIDDNTYGLAEIYYHKCDITIEPGLLPATHKFVLLHEILHCAGLDHIDTIEPQIMNTRAPADWVIRKDWTRMVDYAKDQLRRHRGR